jgi:hypothetical protein
MLATIPSSNKRKGWLRMNITIQLDSRLRDIVTLIRDEYLAKEIHNCAPEHRLIHMFGDDRDKIATPEDVHKTTCMYMHLYGRDSSELIVERDPLDIHGIIIHFSDNKVSGFMKVIGEEV